MRYVQNNDVRITKWDMNSTDGTHHFMNVMLNVLCHAACKTHFQQRIKEGETYAVLCIVENVKIIWIKRHIPKICTIEFIGHPKQTFTHLNE